ncbi:glycosyl hydrolase [Mangrovibacterium sp.]|uniref:glycosyl hydrolase n=1 Tax=Mangrovibacterium sp. TaxID=1961364 RepID=UPI00356721F1
MKFFLQIAFILLLKLGLFAQEKGSVFLEDNFKNPPSSAKARTWWHWMNGNVSREGITADLEAMKKVGIQEAQLFSASIGEPQGSATYLSDEWLELFQFAASEAQRLGLELAFHNGPGWSSSGGPWITPEKAMQTLVFSEVAVEGGKTFNDFLPQPETRLNYYKDIAVLAFPKPKTDERIEELDIKNLSDRVRNHLAPDAKPIPESALVHQADIIDLTDKFSLDGMLEWNVPEGDWIILRMGHTPTGHKNISAPFGGQGLECDKMSRKAVDVFWAAAISPIIEKLDTLVGSVLTNCLIDSYEVGATNWTPGFANEFNRLRGYDCSLFLPALAGYYVESGELSERFLWDFRRTIGDLIAENYYAYFRDKCHEHNLKFSVEPYWGPFDNMQVGATGDIVMCEYWSGELAFFDSPKFVASIANLNGSSIVGAEAFTDMGGWTRHPANFKAIGDMAWAQGINRFIFHTYIHQPWNVAPGLTLGPFGIDFNRLNTWWDEGKVFLDYVARGQFLLQEGKSFADILVFTGEASPNDGLLMPELKALGYDYDLIGANKIDLLTVEEGLICTPVGGKYQALVLPETTWLTPETLKIIETLAKSGAKLFGSRPQKSPSLQNYPECDKQVVQLSSELWDSSLVKEGSVLDFLKNGTLPPDFSIEEGSRENLNYIHRKTKETDIYFVASSRKESRVQRCRFRVAGKQPELWNAETGEITNATVWKDNGDGTTSVHIQLEAEGSVFVVFRNPIATESHIESMAMELQKPQADPLPDLRISKAEYGTFLPDGLVDVTEIVANSVQNNTLNIRAGRDLCSCDPAPGYKKELRIEYQMGNVVLAKNAMETEYLILDATGQAELKIRKAVFGKFERGVPGIPANKPVYDITEAIRSLVTSGVLEIPVADSLVDEISDNNKKKALRLVYSTNGEEKTNTVPDGGKLKLTQATSEPKLVYKNGKTLWRTPYPGALTYTTSSGETKTLEVKSVPKPVELSGAWLLQFPNAEKTTFDKLISWTESADDNIRYFSGTASYKKEFTLTKEMLKDGTSLEIDFGSVKEIAEVILNGQNLGILWKAPFRINMDKAVKEGTNKLEVRVTNLWPNRLIGDEQLPLDYERTGNKIKQWPDWLINETERPTKRTTFPAYKHWGKDSKLLPSGLIGRVRIIISKEIEIR